MGINGYLRSEHRNRGISVDCILQHERQVFLFRSLFRYKSHEIENGILNGSKHKTKPHALRLQNEHSILKTLYHGFIKRKRQTRTNPSKRPRIEVDEELMRQMIAGQAPLVSKVVRRIPDPKEENTDAPQENISDTAPGVSVSTAEKQMSIPK